MRKRYFIIPLTAIIIAGVLVWACKHPQGVGVEGITRAVEIPIYLSQEDQNSEKYEESDVLFNGNNQIPALTVTVNKVILAAAGTSSGNVSIKRSLDMGRTWSDNVRILDNGYSYPFFINCHNGDILLGVTTATKSSNSETIFYRSKDDGVTWNKDSGSVGVNTVCKDAYDGYATYGQGIALRHGENQNSQKLMFPYFYNATNKKDAKPEGYFVAIMSSDNNGQKFNSVCKKFSGEFSDDIGSFGSYISKIIELANGNILLNMRTKPGFGNGYTFWMLSENCGETWKVTVNNKSHENIQGKQKNQGVYGKNADFIRYEFNGKDIKPNGSQWALMVTSYENKQGYEVMLTKNDFNNGKPEGGTANKYAYTKELKSSITGGYPAITVLPDGTIGTLVEFDNEGMYFARFNLYWLTGGKEKVDYSSGDASLMFQ